MTQVRKNSFEWVVFGFSTLLVAGLLIILFYLAIANGSNPPDISIDLGTAEATSTGYRLPFTVKNDGQKTAESVTVEIQLLQDGMVAETSEVIFDYLPRGSQRSAVALFTLNPAEADSIEKHISNYQTP